MKEDGFRAVQSFIHSAIQTRRHGCSGKGSLPFLSCLASRFRGANEANFVRLLREVKPVSARPTLRHRAGRFENSILFLRGFHLTDATQASKFSGDLFLGSGSSKADQSCRRLRAPRAPRYLPSPRGIRERKRISKAPCRSPEPTLITVRGTTKPFWMGVPPRVRQPRGFSPSSDTVLAVFEIMSHRIWVTNGRSVSRSTTSYIFRNVSSRRYVHASGGRDGTKVKAEDLRRWRQSV